MQHSYDLNACLFQCVAHKFGFSVGKVRTRGTLWNQRFFKLFLNRIEYYTKDPELGGELKGTMRFSQTTYARAVTQLPASATAKGFSHLLDGGDPESWTPEVDISRHFPTVIAIYNCVHLDRRKNQGARCFLMAWDDRDSGEASREELLLKINAWLPCDAKLHGRLPSSLLPSTNTDPRDAATCESSLSIEHPPIGVPTREPCEIVIHSGVDEGGWAHRCDVQVFAVKPAKGYKGPFPAPPEKDGDPDPRLHLCSLLEDNGDGSYVTTFVPSAPGNYRVHVNFWDRPATNSPYVFRACAQRFELFGGGIQDGFTSEKSHFWIRAWNTETGEPELDLETKLHAAFQIADGELQYATICPEQDKGSYMIEYDGRTPGRYQVWVTLGFINVPGSPFKVTLRSDPVSARVAWKTLKRPRGLRKEDFAIEHPEATDPVHILCMTPCPRFPSGLEARFCIILLDQDSAPIGFGGDLGDRLTVTLLDSTGDGKPDPTFSVTDNDDSSYGCKFTPKCKRGWYELHIQLGGEHVAGSPLSIRVAPEDPAFVRHLLAVQRRPAQPGQDIAGAVPADRVLDSGDRVSGAWNIRVGALPLNSEPAETASGVVSHLTWEPAGETAGAAATTAAAAAATSLLVDLHASSVTNVMDNARVFPGGLADGPLDDSAALSLVYKTATDPRARAHFVFPDMDARDDVVRLVRLMKGKYMLE